MLEDIKKGLLAGFGSIFLTKDKIEETVKKMVEQAKISREDADKLANELVKVGEERWTELEKAVTELTRKGMTNLDVCRRSELVALENRVLELEKRLAALEESPTSGTD
jgi:polyhydroxyalkanoate synthesis regulator phasin